METVHDLLRELAGFFGGGAKHDAAMEIINTAEADAKNDVAELRAQVEELRSEVAALRTPTTPTPAPDPAPSPPDQVQDTPQGGQA